jgi:hypothetical protein
MAQTPVSFAADLRSQLFTYRDQMAWRLDLGDYDDVKANAKVILPLINSQPPVMPPTPFPPFPKEFIDKFAAWIAQGCPP